jgi:hypothetical protein
MYNHLKNEMKTKILILSMLLNLSQPIFSQSYPAFGPEIKVTITGLTFDAMEPFISIDGNTLFFNSLNSGGNTNLYYATKINDTTFNYVGMVAGTYDPAADHLDAVASLDSANNFFWVSLRALPNLHTGNYTAGNVINVSQVFGTCNILAPSGWIIMDAAINYSGNLLYYSNGYFGPTFTECVGAPCEAKLGIAQKINDSTFNKTSYSDGVFTNINDTNYIVYAPQITKDGLEIYYTRILKGGFNTEICVSVRTTLTDTFSLPNVIHSNLGYFPEAATPTTDKSKIYYHQKDSALNYRIFLRYKTGTIGIVEHDPENTLNVYPSPANNVISVQLPMNEMPFEISIYTLLGSPMLTSNTNTIDVTTLYKGIYFLNLKQNNKTWATKFIKN